MKPTLNQGAMDCTKGEIVIYGYTANKGKLFSSPHLFYTMLVLASCYHLIYYGETLCVWRLFSLYIREIFS